MNTSNPFVPTVSLITVPQRSRHARLKFAAFTVVMALLTYFTIQWIRDWRDDYMMTTAGDETASAMSPHPDQKAGANPALRASEANLASRAVQTTSGAAMLQSTQSMAKESAASNSTRPEQFHVVKSGDTLFELARTYGTTVKAIKTANGLTTERLAIGTKLRISE